MRGERVDLLQLRYFQAVARHEHVSRAADELRVSQPALSRTIARLETELGVPLFDRQGRRIQLNRFGATFLRRIDRALGELDGARRELADAAGLEHGSVAVAAETLFTLTGVLKGFLAENPGVDVRLYQSSAAAMAQQLRTGGVDLCFASQPLTGPSLRTMELLREEVLLAVPLTHPLAGRDRTDIASVAGEPFITTRPGYWVRALAERLFTDAGLRPNIICEGDDLGATEALIAAGLGVGLMPAMSRRADSPAPVAWIHLDAPNCHRSLTAVWRDDTYLSIAATHFRDFAFQRFQTSHQPETGTVK